MFKTLRNAFKVKDVRKKLVFTLMMLFVIRLGCQIPVPGTDSGFIKELLGKNNTVSGILGMMSGGSLEEFGIFALGIGPYITASIIIQLLTAAFPALEEMQKSGEDGRKKLQSLTRYTTIALSVLQGCFLSISFGRGNLFGENWGGGSPVWLVISTTIILTAGSACLMWIGERITERGVGNGISIVLTINILARMPQDFKVLGERFIFVEGKKILPKMLAVLIIAAIIIAMVVFVIYLQDGVRKIPVQYSKKVQGNKLVGGQQSHIPLRVNTAGVIPVIFASTLLSLPQIIQSYGNFENKVWVTIVNTLSQSNWFSFTSGNYKWYYIIGAILYVLMVFGFSYFYTSFTFNPTEVATNIKKNGGLIPSVRAGSYTEEYLKNILKYLVFIGAIGLSIVALAPIVASGLFRIAQVSFGGTSIIIIVSVILETIKQVESQMVQRNYTGFLIK